MKTLILCTVVILGLAGETSAQSQFDGIVVFGTSLSDAGNAFVLSGVAGTPPDFTLNPLLIPTAPYATGGHHVSNGATWIEQYAISVGLAASMRPALATSDAGAANYAVGAARSYDDGINFNLTRQVDTFLERSGGAASPHALYVIEMGGNDIRDAFQLYAVGANGGPILQAALGSIAANIQRLYTAGARQFLVWLPPNVALTPAIRSLGPAAGELATVLTANFDGGLAQMLDQLPAVLPGARFARLDANQLLNAIVDTPWAFGLTTVVTACVTPNTAPFTCNEPDEFLFWDGIHPTKAGHALVAEEAARVLSAF
jgi:phospholipase/lecithinase/hemolysin